MKPGGGENVAVNYGRILNEMDIASVFVGKEVDSNYSASISNVGKIRQKLLLADIKRADYIFIHSNKNLLLLFFLYFIPIKLGKKRVFYIQHLMFPRWKFIALSCIINLFCTDFIRISPITASLVDRYIRITSHFIVNFYISKYSEEQKSHLKKMIYSELEIKDHQRIVTFSGVLKPGKNIGDFLKLAEKFRDEDQFVFLIIGDGQEANLITSYRYSNIKWLGFVTDVERYLAATEYYFFSSLFKQEMLPMALVEAVNSNTKVLAYSTAINDFLLNGNTCKSFDEVVVKFENNKWPDDLSKFNRAYALTVFKQVLLN